jgi:predicted transposase/invertase (TIGR01784 family)
MIKTLYDERVFVKGKQEGKAEGEKAGIEKTKIEMAKKMLIKGEPIEKIMEYSELTEAEIREIEKTL